LSAVSVVLAGLFLPLFPLSIVFNRLVALLAHPVPRVALLAVWPLAGVELVTNDVHGRADSAPPDWVSWWALGTALLYAFRLVTTRDVHTWLGFLATSEWALLWLELQAGAETTTVRAHALGFSLPLALAALIAAALDRRFGAAYTHVYGGLGRVLPRLSTVMTVTVVAVTATPVFPAFFVLLHVLMSTTSTLALVLVLLTALAWSWAGIRLLQGLIVGRPDHDAEPVEDLHRAMALAYLLALATMASAGLYLSGDLA
jgi:NADH:ubiquinone oxidoreductase subunit 4 (subunit M)